MDRDASGLADTLLAEDNTALADLDWKEPAPSPLVHQANALGMSAPPVFRSTAVTPKDFKSAVDKLKDRDSQPCETDEVHTRYCTLCLSLRSTCVRILSCIVHMLCVCGVWVCVQ